MVRKIDRKIIKKIIVPECVRSPNQRWPLSTPSSKTPENLRFRSLAHEIYCPVLIIKFYKTKWVEKFSPLLIAVKSLNLEPPSAFSFLCFFFSPWRLRNDKKLKVLSRNSWPQIFRCDWQLRWMMLKENSVSGDFLTKVQDSRRLKHLTY